MSTLQDAPAGIACWMKTCRLVEASAAQNTTGSTSRMDGWTRKVISMALSPVVSKSMSQTAQLSFGGTSPRLSAARRTPRQWGHTTSQLNVSSPARVA